MNDTVSTSSPADSTGATIATAPTATAATPQAKRKVVVAATAKAKPAARKPVVRRPAIKKADDKSESVAAAKAAPKRVTKTAVAGSKVKPVVSAMPPKEAKETKEAREKKVSPKKQKLLRDSFTFPENDYALIRELKQRVLLAGREIKKSELLRAGLAALAQMPEAQLLKIVDGVERIKTGRPAK